MKEHLKNIPIFSDFDSEELDLLEKHFYRKTYEKDETVADEAHATKEIYIISSGKIACTLNLPGSIKRKHGEYGPGDFFGGISLFGDKPSFNSFHACDRTEIVAIMEKDILELIENNPKTAIKFIEKLLGMTIRQLRRSSRFLADVVQWGENASRRTITDELTGLYNRAFLDDALESFFNISKSNNKPLSLLMIDLDNFRKINEKYSQETGNRILIEVVTLIKNIISKHGIIARYGGGDELSILLPETDLARAGEIAEGIRSRVENQNFSKYFTGETLPITVSIGISSFPETATELDTFREKADSSLYQAKKLGKNRVAFLE